MEILSSEIHNAWIVLWIVGMEVLHKFTCIELANVCMEWFPLALPLEYEMHRNYCYFVCSA